MVLHKNDTKLYKGCFFLIQVDAADPAFPRSTAYWWFGCKSAPQGTIGGRARQTLNNNGYGEVSDIGFDAGEVFWDARIKVA